jgi:hypothetical protein
MASVPLHPRERCESIERLPCGFGYRYEVKLRKGGTLIQGSCHDKTWMIQGQELMTIVLNLLAYSFSKT